MGGANGQAGQRRLGINPGNTRSGADASLRSSTIIMKRNRGYWFRKNWRKGFRRRAARRRVAMEPVYSGILPGIEIQFLNETDAFALAFPEDRLRQTKSAVRRLESLRRYTHSVVMRTQGQMSTALIITPHEHHELKRPSRIFNFTNSEIMIKSLQHLFSQFPLTRFSKSINSYHDCPRHPGGGTLRIFPTRAGDFYFRCHQCGNTLLTLEFFERQRHYRTYLWQQLAADALEQKIIQEPVSKEALLNLDGFSGGAIPWGWRGTGLRSMSRGMG